MASDWHKVAGFHPVADGLVPNMLAFNVGVELGQLLAFAGILILMGFCRLPSSIGRRTASTPSLCAPASCCWHAAHRLLRFLTYRGTHVHQSISCFPALADCSPTAPPVATLV
jgi:hypothetical protein